MSSFYLPLHFFSLLACIRDATVVKFNVTVGILSLLFPDNGQKTDRRANRRTDTTVLLTRLSFIKLEILPRRARRPLGAKPVVVVASSSSLSKETNSRPVLFPEHLHSRSPSSAIGRASCVFITVAFPDFRRRYTRNSPIDSTVISPRSS